MMVIHHLNNSRSQRVLWLAEELGIEYEVKRYERSPMAAPPELRAVHPLGKSPVVTDGSVTVAETGAIVEYLVSRHGKGQLVPPAETPERLRYTYWLHYAEGSAMTPLLMGLVLGMIGDVGDAVVPARGFIAHQTDVQFDYVEAELGKSTWFAGDAFTAADIIMSFPLEVLEASDRIGTRPNIRAFLERIHRRPAYVKALERGGPYSMKF